MKQLRRDTSKRRPVRPRKVARNLLGVERLESRYALDGSLPNNGVDVAPLVQTVADQVTVNENSQNNILSLLANDIFSPGYQGAKKITSVSVTNLGGSVNVSDDGASVRYTPPPGHYTSFQNGSVDNGLSIDRFTYVVDGQFSETVQVNVQRFLRDDSFAFLQNDGSHLLSLLANDNLPANYAGPRKITALSATTAEGSITLNADGQSVVYQAAADFVGIEQFSYVVDGIYDALVRISVATPVRGDYFSVLRNSPETEFAVRQNDCFESPYYSGGVCTTPDVQQITSVGIPDRGGAVRIAADGRTVFYRPAAGYVGSETFSYIADGKFQTTVSIYVSSPDDTFTVLQNSGENSLTVLSNDYFPAGYSGSKRITDIQQLGDTYTQSTDGAWQRNRIAPNPDEVRISANGETLIFTPTMNFVGSRTYIYKVDGAMEATVNVFVTSMLQSDSQRVLENSLATSINVLANDAFPANYAGAKRITSVTASNNGATVQISSDGKLVSYQPARGFYGNDVFKYTVDDSQVAEVTVSVQRPFGDAGGTVDQFTVANDLDALRLNDAWRKEILSTYSGPKKITAVGTPDKGGTVTIASNGEGLRYTPLASFAGTEKFTFTVDDNFTATYSVQVVPGVQADSLIVQENGVGESLSLLLNDRFVANYGGPKKITSLGVSPQGASVVLDAATQTVRYTPAKDFYGFDSFTYTVDGVQTARVELKVVRGVRDDRFHVVGGSQNNSLPVLVNDDFGRLYEKAKRITAVSAASEGGAVSIASDGHSLLYTPAVGFTGVDRLTYVVDGQYTAQVTIAVSNERVLPQPSFSTESDLTQYLLEKGDELYGDRFGKTEYGWPYYPVYYNTTGVTDVARVESQSSPSHSETNVQVAGVDEGDIVETDGHYVYVLTGQELVIVDSFPVADAQVVSRYPFAGTPVAEFLRGTTLTVISQSWQATSSNLPTASDSIRVAPLRPVASTSVITLTVLDVSDRSSPQLVQETKVDGAFFESRAMGNYVYLALRNDFAPPEPTRICQSLTAAERLAYQEQQAAFTSEAYLINSPTEKCVIETREQYAARSANFASDSLPYYTSYDKDGNVMRSGLLLDTTDIYGKGGAYSSSLYTLLAFDVSSADPGPVSTIALLTGSENYIQNPPVLFASKDSIYLFAPQSAVSPEDTVVTQVWQVHLDKLSGAIQPIASGQLPGTVLNQFSIDEMDGYLRVATTNYSLNTSGTENNIFILREDKGELEFVGALQDLAPSESIYGVRFFDDRAIVVTFRQMDPLFAIDLSNPAQPVVAGALKLPGFSNYIQPIDRDHVLTFGRSGPNGADGPPQVSLFNIQDLSRPTLIDQALVGKQMWSVDAWSDHHAVAYFSEYNVLALPLNETRWDWKTQKSINTQATLVFKIDPTPTQRSDLGIVPLGKVESDSTVRRNVRIEDSLYSISDSAIQIVNVLDPQEKRGEVQIALSPNYSDTPVSVTPGDPSLPRQATLTSASPSNNTKLQPLIAAVRNHLAASVGEIASTSVIVTAERLPNSGTEAYQIVARNIGRQYLYRAEAGGDVVQLSNDFEFSQNSSDGGWHNTNQPMDSNGDGFVAPIDVLVIINELNRNGPRSLAYRTAVRAIEAASNSLPPAGLFFFDVNQDGYVAPNDVLLVINYLNRQTSGASIRSGEGEEGPPALSIANTHAAPALRSMSSIQGVTRMEPVPGSSSSFVSQSNEASLDRCPDAEIAAERRFHAQALEEVLAQWGRG